ncbi:MAG: hypothetical protein FJ290_09270 [Planctomycetes bacterium]|nr:hypothetical protein [Planctomycetota bacterium]
MGALHTRCIFAAAVLAAALTGCAVLTAHGPQEWPWGRTRRGLQSRIVFERHVYKQGEPIVCWVEVRNASDRPVPYDGRVGANVTIAGPNGQKVRALPAAGEATIDVGGLLAHRLG